MKRDSKYFPQDPSISIYIPSHVPVIFPLLIRILYYSISFHCIIYIYTYVYVYIHTNTWIIDESIHTWINRYPLKYLNSPLSNSIPMEKNLLISRNHRRSPSASLSLGSAVMAALEVRRLAPMWRADCTSPSSEKGRSSSSKVGGSNKRWLVGDGISMEYLWNIYGISMM